MRRLLPPRLSGLGNPYHVALTFDDGPDTATTPYFLDALEALQVRATFFVLGSRVARLPGLTREIVAAGHELGVHGWDHRCVAWSSPRAAAGGVHRTRNLIIETTGQVPRWYRPAYGVASFPALWAAAGVGLTPVLWTDWGRDWIKDATADSVAMVATANLKGRAVLLLHDAPAGNAHPGGWQATLEALPLIVARCRVRALEVGPLSEHGLPLHGRGQLRAPT